MRMWLPVVLAGVVVSCGVGSVGDTGPVTADASVGPDASTAAADSGPSPDSGALVDAGQAMVTDSGRPDAGPKPCPTAPPFDENDVDLVARCTKPVFVAIGNLNHRAISNDLVTFKETWIPKASLPPDTNFDLYGETSAIVRNGIIIVIGANGVFTSKNGGDTFTEATGIAATGFTLYGSGLGYLNGTFWLVANGGTWSSTDGSKWAGTQGDVPVNDAGLPSSFGGHGHGVASGNGRIIFTNDNARYRMFDGTTWVEARVGDYGGFGTGITFGNGAFVMTGGTCCNIPSPNEYGLRARSTDGLSWQVITNDTPNAFQVSDFGGVIWDGARYYATAGPWSREAYESADGLEWKKTPINTAIGTVAIQGDVWGAIQQVNVVRSTDKGATWTVALPGTGENADNWYNNIVSGRVLK